MLQNASIKTKLGAILLLPLLCLGVLAGLRVADNLTRGRQADRMHDITTFALSLSGLVHELQRERDLSAGYVGSGKTSGYGRMIAQRSRSTRPSRGSRASCAAPTWGPTARACRPASAPPRPRWPGSTGSGTGSAPTSRSPSPRCSATTTT